MSKRRERYKVDSIVGPAPYDPRLLALYEDKSKLVGIDRPREEIINLLSMEGEGEVASEQKLKLVSIVGPGGIGKTTLANAVYQKIQEKFDCTAFVSVSLQPNLKNILSSLLRQVTITVKDDPEDKDKSLHRRESQKHYGNTETWSEKELIDKIRHVLEKRRYLILIDDIWEEKPWKLIECALFENKLGSKVITTTRNIDVAKSCCSSDKVDGIIHELQPLSKGDSEQLFYYKIFSKDGCPTELKVVSKKILEKCEGWPLAIITIASLFANKPTQTIDQWNSVYDSISTGLENNDGVKDMRLILSLSYRDMPAQLRDCLLYLSIFPEDHIIVRDDLIRRWIAEDLVHGRQDDSLNELGHRYFDQLINRSMIQPSDLDAFGRARACKVHDLVLEFITFLSAEEDFVTILNGKQSFPPQPDSIHRVSLRNQNGEVGIPQATKRLPHVRTLVVSSHAIDSMPSLSIFPVLRVLELEQCTNSNIRGVENLVHLRYLRLSQAYHSHYDTLDLKEARIKEFPSILVQFRQLRLLEISVCKCDKTCEKRLLQFLCDVDWTPRHLQKFTSSLFPRKRIEHVLSREIVWAVTSPFSKLPRWINSSLSNLCDLSIMVRTLQQADLEILADLLILRSMDLEVVEATGTRLEINGSVGGTDRATAFRCLGNLKFASRVMGLVFRPGAMKNLQKLYLCFDVAETKDVHGDFDVGFAGLENLTSVRTLNVEIDCRCAMLWEVEAAEAALCNATNLNPNCPTLDLKRRFVAEMLHDQEEETPEHLQAKKKKDVALLSRVGPFGGSGGRARDIRVAPYRLENVTIGSRDCVEALAFSYTDHDGQQHSVGPWGHPAKNSTSTFSAAYYYYYSMF
uniref:AAA+ ATPase domain-containing protein n=1 Tax=Leersia perrieri TaxID=77586 RepID=A0A0D9VY51_9ORYZ